MFVPCPKDGWVEGTIEDIERDGTLLVKLDNNQVSKTVSILFGSMFSFVSVNLRPNISPAALVRGGFDLI